MDNNLITYNNLRNNLIANDPNWKVLSSKEKKRIATMYLTFMLKLIRETERSLEKYRIQYGNAVKIFTDDIGPFWTAPKEEHKHG